MRGVLAVGAALVALLCAFAPSSAQTPSAPPSVDAFYSEAVASMRALPQPQYLSYVIEGDGNGLDIHLQVMSHLVWLEMGTSLGSEAPTPVRWWTLKHRTEDYSTEILSPNGRRLVTTRPFFDPTWYGAFRALRDGMLSFQQQDAPLAASATPTPGPTPDLRTIAVVQVIGSAIYRVEDRGAATCANGDDGHALHLVSKDSNPRHQLTDVVVDLRNMHFCTVKFNNPSSGFSGSVEEHFSNVDGYWLQTDGQIETTVRHFGMQSGHGIWRYQIDGIKTPRTIEAAAFVPPPDQ